MPDAYNTVVTMEAYKDVTGSTKGPFPVVLFSHGASAYRMANSALTAGIASWGFVVVSVDYLERGVVTQLPGQKPLTLDPERDKRLMLASLDLVTKENDRSASLLHGIVDGTRVAAAGHSAGGTTAFDALNDPRVKVAVGWAPSAPSATPADKPTMIIGASNDIGVPPTQLAKTYGSFPAPKRRVEIGNAGHNSFTDLCVVTRSGGGMVQYAAKNHLVSQALAKLLLNGCEKTALTPEKFWPVVQHFTVAELRAALGIDAQPVGLGDGISRAFPGYQRDLPSPTLTRRPRSPRTHGSSVPKRAGPNLAIGVSPTRRLCADLVASLFETGHVRGEVGRALQVIADEACRRVAMIECSGRLGGLSLRDLLEDRDAFVERGMRVEQAVCQAFVVL